MFYVNRDDEWKDHFWVNDVVPKLRRFEDLVIGRKYRSDTRRADCEGGGVYTNSRYQSSTGGIFDTLE